MRRYTTSPLAMFFTLPVHRTEVRLHGLLKCALPDGRLLSLRARLLGSRVLVSR